jgi:hypothetical protein
MSSSEEDSNLTTRTRTIPAAAGRALGFEEKEEKRREAKRGEKRVEFVSVSREEERREERKR